MSEELVIQMVLITFQTNKKRSSFKIGNLSCLFLHFIDSELLTQDKSCHLKVWNLKNDSPSCIYEKEFNNISFCKINVLRNQLAIPQPKSVVEVHQYASSTSLVARLSYPDESVKLGEVQQLKLFDHTSSLHAAVVYENGSLAIWHVGKSELVSKMKITDDTPMAFDFDAEKLQGVCGTNERIIVFFKLDKQLQVTKMKEIEITNAGVGCLRVRPDKKVLAAGCWDGRIRIFSWKTCKLLAALECHKSSVLDVAFAPPNQSSVFAASASDKKISLWNIFE